jgi:Asp-tRNA(Asn)/Glu-tRNA(Gln) amidotransferase C subunit
MPPADAPTEEQWAQVARVARLPLSAEERARLAEEAARILAQFAEVEAGLARPAAPSAVAPLPPRPDEPLGPEPEAARSIVAQFPRRSGELCRVPEGL